MINFGLKDFAKEVIHCNCETFEERRELLFPTMLVSALIFGTIFTLFYPALPTTIKLASVGITILSFVLTCLLASRFKKNPILSMPSMFAIGLSYYFILHPQLSTVAPKLWMIYQGQAIVYGLFIASIRCNVVISAMLFSIPFVTSALNPIINLEYMFYESLPILSASLMSIFFSYKNTVNKKQVYLKYNEADRLRLENQKLLNLHREVKELALIAGFEYDYTHSKFLWSDEIIKFLKIPFCFEKNHTQILGLLNIHQRMQLRERTSFAIENQTSFDLELDIKNFQGEFLSIKVHASKDIRTNKILGFVQDMTKVKEVEKELNSERLRSIQNSKLATLGEMAAGVAHEINNPLSIMMTGSELLDNGDLAPNIQEKTIQKIKRAGDRISKIVNGLKKFSRTGVESHLWERFSINSIVKESLEMVQHRTIDQKVKIELDLIEDDFILCDEVQISQIIINLIVNSLDAISKQENQWIKIQSFKRNNKLEVHISDSGNGIPEDVLEKLFNPFFTTKGVGVGTGLGLSISQGIAKSHQGDLTYQLKNGHTCFILTIPLTIGAEDAA